MSESSLLISRLHRSLIRASNIVSTWNSTMCMFKLIAGEEQKIPSDPHPIPKL